jgi:GDP-4-dehydro-6-deoxy-D-mannose reductase
MPMAVDKEKQHKVLILGGAGFVGRHLIRLMQQYANARICATKLPEEGIECGAVRIRDLDILSASQVEGLFGQERPDIVFHLAAQSSVALSWSNPGLTVDINGKGTIHVLEAARKQNPAPRILLIGSSEEYGNIASDQLPTVETLPPHPENVYAATKALQSMLGRIYCKAYGMDIVMARAFNHIGPGQSAAFVVPSLCRQIVRIEKGLAPPVILVGNLDAQRDFTDVRDIVQAYAQLAYFGEKGEIYNIGSGRTVSVGFLLEKLLAMSPVRIGTKIDPARMRPAEMPVIMAGIEKISRRTGWAPKIPLDQTLRDTLEYWRMKPEADLQAQ